MSAIAFVSTGTLAKRFAPNQQANEPPASTYDSQVASAAATLVKPTATAWHQVPPVDSSESAALALTTEEQSDRPAVALAKEGNEAHQSEPAASDPPQPALANAANAGQLLVSASWLTEQLNNLRSDLFARVSQMAAPPLTFSGPPQTTPATVQMVAHSSKIDQLTGTTLSNVTVSGVSGLTDADIPNSITASNYFPLSGLLTGTDLTLSGNLTADTLSVAGIASDGAVAAPYFTATSTTEASSFASRVGIGTTSPSTDLHIYANDTSFSRLYVQQDGNGRAGLRFKTSSADYIVETVTGFDSGRLLFFDNSPSGAGTYVFKVGGNAVHGRDGTGALPGYSFISDIDTGIFRGGTNVLGFATGGSERVRITSSGNVGIGTTSPFAKLSVTGSGTGTGKAFAVEDSAGTNSFVIQDNGNVGIGRFDPQDKLHIRRQGTGNNGGIRFSTGSETTWSVGYLNNGTNSFYVKNQRTGAIPFTITDTGGDGVPNFALTGSGAYFTNGNVGIGTTSPESKLVISGDADVNEILDAVTVTSIGGGGSSMQFTGDEYMGRGLRIGNQAHVDAGNYSYVTTSGGESFSLRLNAGINSSGNTGFLDLNRFGNSAAMVRMGTTTIERNLYVDGNVGIGTASPGQLLTLQSTQPVLRLQDSDSVGAGVVANIEFGSNLSGNWSRTAFIGDGASGNQRLYLYGDSGTDIGLYTNANATPRMVIDTTGNVGIGTTSPDSKLDVYGTARFGSDGSAVIFGDSGSTNQKVRINPDSNGVSYIQTGASASDTGADLVVSRYLTGSSNLNSLKFYTETAYFSGKVGIGTTTLTNAALHLEGGTYADSGIKFNNTANSNTDTWRIGERAISSSDTWFGVSLNNATAGSDLFVVKNTGYVGIGTTSPTAQLHTTGSVRFSNFGAGTLETDASGNVTVASDEELKEDIEPFARSLEELMQIDPISFRWKAGSGMDTSTEYTGFSAQNVKAAIPEAVGERPDGMMSLSTRAILAAAVNAIKDLAQTVSSYTERFATKELCVGNICVTEAEFAEVFGSGAHNSGASSATSATRSNGEAATTTDAAPSASDPEAEEMPPTSISTADTATSTPSTNDPDNTPHSEDDEVNEQIATSTPTVNDNMPDLTARSSPTSGALTDSEQATSTTAAQ